MNKMMYFRILIFVLCFCGNAFAGLSDREKIDIIRGLAVPSPKLIFYEWMSEIGLDTIFVDGEIITEIYKYVMRSAGHFSLAGPGIYVDEFGHGFFGDQALIQVEVEEGYRYLDLSNERILQSLKEKGITLEDVYRLNSNVALMGPYDYETFASKIIFQGTQGIKIVPLTGKGLSLSGLVDLLMDDGRSEEKQETILNAIKEDIQNRAERYIALLDPQKRVSEAKLNRELRKLSGKSSDAVVSFIDVGDNLLILGDKILSKKTLRTIAEYMVSRDNNYGQFWMFHNNASFALWYLSSSSISKMVKHEMRETETAENLVEFLTAVGQYDLSEKDVTRLVEAIIPLLTIAQGRELLKDASYREYYKQFIREEAPTLEDLREDIKKYPENSKEKSVAMARHFRELLSPGITQTLQDLDSGFGKNYTLSPADREKVIDKMLQSAQSEQELYSWPLFPAELEKAIEKFKHDEYIIL